jgi:hypothetical protein
MDWKNSKTWLLVAGVLVAALAIYAFAGTNDQAQAEPSSKAEAPRAGIRTAVTSKSGTSRELEIQTIREIEPGETTNLTRRDLFAYVEAPVRTVVARPTPPVTPAPSTPPPDSDKDTIPDFRDNCPSVYNPDQTDIDRDGIGAGCETDPEIPPPPPLPAFPYKYIGTFGSARNPLATFSRDGEVINVRMGETFGQQFILRNIGIESVDIGYVGRSEKTRIPIGQ